MRSPPPIAASCRRSAPSSRPWPAIRAGSSSSWADRSSASTGPPWSYASSCRRFPRRSPEIDLPLFYSRWRSLLRGLSSLENYRKVHGARLESADALQFLLFDPHSPRSLRFGTAAVKDLLEQISGSSELSLPARVIGKLASELAYQGEDVLLDGRCLPFLDHVLGELARTHETLSTTYFGT